MSRKFLFFFIVIFPFWAFSQTPSLYGSHTLFDSFENPSITAFAFNKTRKYATNIGIPSLGLLNLQTRGDFADIVVSVYYDRKFDLSEFNYKSTKKNYLYATSNNYLFMYRFSENVYDHVEHGISWQIRSSVDGFASNDVISLLGQFSTLPENNLAIDSKNNLKVVAQAFHQISYVYKKKKNDVLTFGLKFSLLSGIFYNEVDLENLRVNYDKPNDNLDVRFIGSFYSSYGNQMLSTGSLNPLGKNLGLSLGASLLFEINSNSVAIVNFKDLGFIRWAGAASIYNYDKRYSYKAQASEFQQQLRRDVYDLTKDEVYQEAFVKPINGRIELMYIKKVTDSYIPNFLFSKSLTSDYDYIYINNNIWMRHWNININMNLNFSGNVGFGLHSLFKFPNWEFYVGTDDIFKTLNILNVVQNSENHKALYEPPLAASFFIGMSFKFGKIIETPSTSNVFPRL